MKIIIIPKSPLQS